MVSSLCSAHLFRSSNDPVKLEPKTLTPGSDQILIESSSKDHKPISFSSSKQQVDGGLLEERFRFQLAFEPATAPEGGGELAMLHGYYEGALWRVMGYTRSYMKVI